MGTRLDPLIHDHDTQEEADAYDAWFRKEVQAGLDQIAQGKTVPHGAVMARIDQIIREAEERRNA